MTRLITTIVFIALLAFTSVSVNAKTPDTERVAATIEILRQSLNAHDYSQLDQSLDADFTYQGQNPGMSKMIMRQVVAGYPNKITAISVLDTSQGDDGWEIAVRVISESESENRNITLGSDYKIIQADIADIQLAGHGPQTNQAVDAKTSLPAVTIVPFELTERLIVVQAEINGVAGNYLVDSGAPSIMLNSTRFSEDNLETFDLDRPGPKGAGGEILGVRAARDLELKWGAIRMQGLGGMATDLSHLEENLGGIEVMGMIGYNVLEQFQVHFDYARKELTLFTLNGANQPVVETQMGDPELSLPFDMMGHIPILPVRIAGVDMKMGLDCGAAGAMLFTKWQEPLEGKYKFIGRDRLVGGDTNVQMGDVVRIDSMQFGNINYADMTFRFNDLVGHGDHPVLLDGLLGYEFLQSQPIAINYRSRQLLLWPRDRKG